MRKSTLPPDDATGQTWHHADEQLFRLAKIGVMPVFGEVLSHERIWAVLSCIRSK